jgi:hypothetical protein
MAQLCRERAARCVIYVAVSISRTRPRYFNSSSELSPAAIRTMPV